MSAKVLTATDGLHSALGASSADRWMNCPASVAVTRNMREPSSVFAASGTASHHLSDVCRRNNEQPRKYLGWHMYGPAQLDDPLLASGPVLQQCLRRPPARVGLVPGKFRVAARFGSMAPR